MEQIKEDLEATNLQFEDTLSPNEDFDKVKIRDNSV